MIISFEECYKTINMDRKVASITAPFDYAIVYIAKKIERTINYLYGVKDCVVILQTGIEVPKDMEDRHIFVVVENPQKAFDKIVRKVYSDIIEEEECNDYVTRDDGITVGRNVIIGENTKIEPGVFLGHRVIIGDRCVIKRGAIIQSAIIGNDCTVYENANIGRTPFIFYNDGDIKKTMISVGKIILKDHVGIGCNTVIDRGTISDSIIWNNTKIDSNCLIGHDCVIEKNVTITGLSIIGSFSHIGEKTNIYSAKILKRLNIGSNVDVLYNSCVMRNVKNNVKVLGYPARVIEEKEM